MKAVVVADNAMQQMFSTALPVNDGTELLFVNSLNDVPADTYLVIDLLFRYHPDRIAQLLAFSPRLVLVDALTETLDQLHHTFARINVWPGFIARKTIEVVAMPQQQEAVNATVRKLGWSCRFAPDIPGMIGPRIVSMIINEAYSTWEQGISEKEEIDIAMKTGTHYPFGPFEWSEQIGIQKVYSLLKRMAEDDPGIEISKKLKIAAGDHS